MVARPTQLPVTTGRLFILLGLSVILLVCLSSWPTGVPSLVSEVAILDGENASNASSASLPNILLVSAFFPLSKSKHTMREYEAWLTQFLSRVSTDVYFYAAPEMEPFIRKCRGNLSIVIDTTYASPFDIPPLAGLRDRYREMHALDREAFRHSPELYAVWNAKPFFLDTALRHSGKQYSHAFWNDAGSFRSNHRFSSWPDPRRVEEIWAESASLTREAAEDVLFFPLTGAPHPDMRSWTEDQGPVDNEVSEGSFFGGSAQAISWWKRTYYAYHDHYLSLGLFVGKDQTLINALFFLFPERIVGVWQGDQDFPGYDKSQGLGACGSEWYYYQFWLSSPAERAAMRAIFRPHWWLFGRAHNPCQVTRLITMTITEDKRQSGRKTRKPRDRIWHCHTKLTPHCANASQLSMATSTSASAGIGATGTIRAITNPLRSTAPSPIPAASQLYEPLAKEVLRRRLSTQILPYALVVSILSNLVWLGWYGLFGFGPLLGASLLVWTLALVPIVLLRKTYLTVSHTGAPSPLALLQKSFSVPLRPRTFDALRTHTLSAFAILAAHVIFDPKMPVFVKSRSARPHPEYTSSAICAPVPSSGCLGIPFQSMVGIHFLDDLLTPSQRSSTEHSLGIVIAPLVLSFAALPLALVVLFVLIPILRYLPLVSLPLRLVRHPHASILRYTGRAWFLGIQTAALWEGTIAIWGWVIREPIRTTSDIRALVSGLSIASSSAPSLSSATSSAFSTAARLSAFASSPVPTSSGPPLFPRESTIYTHLAYSELLALSSPDQDDGKKARADIFDVDGMMWSRLVREALLCVGREYRVLVDRGTTPAVPSSPNPSVAAPPPKAITPGAPNFESPVKTMPLLKQNIFAKNAPTSPGARLGDALASEAVIEGLVAPVVDILPVPDIRLPEWGQYTAVPAWAQSGVDTVRRITGNGFVGALPDAWKVSRKGKEVRGWVPRSEVVAEAIILLTDLTCASLTEDRFGTVQRDIPKILEAFVLFLGEIDAVKAAMRAHQEMADPADLEEAAAAFGDLDDALREGLARIVRTFGTNRLRAFRFAPRVATKVQEFADFST
ncbi:unnamed protein product [Mycena citricolor]|uniref:Uncharacterized protein n=1 Tax=Mycena citricolor TaxID=2018698 RepID=A0AAD2Q7B0_9AGAR|nr:unnamed protein product [Mycena citricolor]